MLISSRSGIAPGVQIAIALGIGLTVTVAMGAVCGRLSQRWGPVPDLVAAGTQLKSMPDKFGLWQLMQEDKLDDLTVQMLACSGYVNRKYINQDSGDVVTISIIVGPPGPISVHTPEICFASRDYTLDGDRQRIELVDAEQSVNTLWRSTFLSNNAIGERLRFYYSWRSEGPWTAAESPRFAFAGGPLLFKLQVAAAVQPGQRDESTDPALEFLQELLKSGWKVQG